MLETKDHHFGTLACGADAVYRFPIKNVYKHEIEIATVRSSCGCTTATIEGAPLKPNEVGYIVANFNTRTYTGSHQATITIQAVWDDNGNRRTGEAQATVQCVVQGGVIVEPKNVQFGEVPQGQERAEKVRITSANAENWSIKTVACNCDHLSVDVGQHSRTAKHVAYDTLVRLTDGAPPGAICEQLLFVSNDAAEKPIPVHVSGQVIPEFRASPEILFMGEVPVGAKVSKRIIVRCNEPVRIRSIEPKSNHFQYKTDETARARHIVEVTFFGREVGKVKETITITSETGDTARVTAYMTTVPAR